MSAYPGADKTSLGEGALLSEDGLGRWSPEFSPVGALVDLAEGTDVDAYVDAVDDPDDGIPLSSTVPNLPSDVQSLERVRSTPLVLAGLLTVLIALTVVHALGAAVRSRRRDLAVLRTFGFTRRQVLAAVAVQATLIALVGLVIGVPVGIVVGRLAWSEVIDRFGGLVDLVTPVGGPRPREPRRGGHSPISSASSRACAPPGPTPLPSCAPSRRRAPCPPRCPL